MPGSDRSQAPLHHPRLCRRRQGVAPPLAAKPRLPARDLPSFVFVESLSERHRLPAVLKPGRFFLKHPEETQPCTSSKLFELDIQPGSPDNPACLRVALLRHATTGQRTDGCSSRRSGPRFPEERWKDTSSSIPFKMSSMILARELAEHSKSPESGKPHQKAADGFSATLRGTLVVSSAGCLPGPRGSGHLYA